MMFEHDRELQSELQARRNELTAGFTVIIDHSKHKQPIITNIDGEMYELTGQDYEHLGETLESARRFGGFSAGYRLVKIGKPI